MITQRNEQVKEKFPTTLHFHLHSATPLKRLATPNNQREIMSAEPRIRVRRIVICIASRSQDGGYLDPTLQTLLAQRQSLELIEPVLLGRTVYDSVFEQVLADAGYVACGFDGSATTCIFGVWRSYCVFKFPRVTALVVQQARVIVALLQVISIFGWYDRAGLHWFLRDGCRGGLDTMQGL